MPSGHSLTFKTFYQYEKSVPHILMKSRKVFFRFPFYRYDMFHTVIYTILVFMSTGSMFYPDDFQVKLY